MSVVHYQQFDIDTGDYDQYCNEALNRIREACPLVNDIPVVGPRPDINEYRWFFLELTTGPFTIILAICVDGLYLYAWRKGNIRETSNWRVTHGETVELPGVMDHVHFSGNYNHLGNPDSVSISRASLSNAVRILYSCDDTRHIHRRAKSAFLQLVVTFCAGLRIKSINRSVCDMLGGSVPFIPVQPIDSIREKQWRQASQKYLDGEEVHVHGYGIINDVCVREHLLALLYHSNGEYNLSKKPDWKSLHLPRKPDGGEDRGLGGKSGGGTSSQKDILGKRKNIQPSSSRNTPSAQTRKRAHQVSAVFHAGTTKSHPTIPEHLSLEAKDFLLKCLQEEPSLRPTASDLLQHPFVTGELEDAHQLNHAGSKKSFNNVLGTNKTQTCNFGKIMESDKVSPARPVWETSNDDDMCWLDDGDDFPIIGSSFNPLSEPLEEWPCKFDISLEQRTLSSQHLVDVIADHDDVTRSMPKGDCSDANEFSFPSDAACEDDDEVTEFKIRAFLDEKALDLKKLQTPLYEEFYNSLKQVLIWTSTASKEKAQAHIRELDEERKLLKNLSHPNIIRYLGTVREENTLNILLEFVPGGSISSLLSKFGSFPEPVIRMYTKQLLQGLEYLHQKKIIHRDIKGANILVDNKGCIKLADFGASKQVAKLAAMTAAKSMKGTPYWMAPEVIVQSGHSL